MLSIFLVVLLIPLLIVKVLFKRWSRSSKPVVGFFHPFCNDGGGGERVLWCLVRAAQLKFKDKVIYQIYYGDVGISPESILTNTKKRFGLTMPGEIEFVCLKMRKWVESQQYPVLTMLGQALGSCVLGLDALLQSERNPSVVFDTMGYAFSYPIFHYFGGAKVLCYTHYPVISTDMLERVIQRRPAHNNDSSITNSATLSVLKSTYYRLFAKLYGVVGRYSSLVIVNSSWTANHIKSIWGGQVHIVYPPVNTETLKEFPINGRENRIISIAQFRPEKDHELQVRAFAEFLRIWSEKGTSAPSPKLVMIGSVRNEGDEKVVDHVRKVANLMALKEGKDFEFAINLPYNELQRYLKTSRVGVHTMWNEHFGIGVVELMAAGVVTIAHNSGGPKMDIMAAGEDGEKLGFLASTVNEYAEAMVQAFELSPLKTQQMQLRARQAVVDLFSEEAFSEKCVKLLGGIIDQEK